MHLMFYLRHQTPTVIFLQVILFSVSSDCLSIAAHCFNDSFTRTLSTSFIFLSRNRFLHKRLHLVRMLRQLVLWKFQLHQILGHIFAKAVDSVSFIDNFQEYFMKIQTHNVFPDTSHEDIGEIGSWMTS